MAFFFPPPPPNVSRSPQPYAGYASANPATGGIAVNNPPFDILGRSPAGVAVGYSWAPDLWIYAPVAHQPYDQRKLFAGMLDVPINPPPISPVGRLARTDATVQWYDTGQPNRWVYSAFGGRQPYEARKLPPQLTAVQVDNPPPTLGVILDLRTTIIDLNQPPPPNAYFGGRQALEPRKLPPPLTAVRVDDPIPPRKFNFWTLSTSWEQPWPNPTLAQHSIQPILPLPRSYVIIIT